MSRDPGVLWDDLWAIVSRLGGRIESYHPSDRVPYRVTVTAPGVSLAVEGDTFEEAVTEALHHPALPDPAPEAQA